MANVTRPDPTEPITVIAASFASPHRNSPHMLT